MVRSLTVHMTSRTLAPEPHPVRNFSNFLSNRQLRRWTSKRYNHRKACRIVKLLIATITTIESDNLPNLPPGLTDQTSSIAPAASDLCSSSSCRPIRKTELTELPPWKHGPRIEAACQSFRPTLLRSRGRVCTDGSGVHESTQ
jgi:hypothetical protein